MVKCGYILAHNWAIPAILVTSHGNTARLEQSICKDARFLFPLWKPCALSVVATAGRLEGSIPLFLAFLRAMQLLSRVVFMLSFIFICNGNATMRSLPIRRRQPKPANIGSA